MIMASLGKLAVNQSLSGSDEDSTNVIQVAAVDWSAFTDLWWVVQTTVIAATTSTFKFSLVFSKEASLTTNVEIMSVLLADYDDLRAATVGNFIAAFNIGDQMKQMLEGDMSDYLYIGGLREISAGTIYVNESLSFTKPHSLIHRMTTISNVVPPSVASGGSGFVIA